MNCLLKWTSADIVFLLEFCGEKNWENAFFHPYEAIDGFKPEMEFSMKGEDILFINFHINYTN